jgi:hypothetical protein
VSSIDMTTAGAVTVTPPAVGLCSPRLTDRVVLMAPYAAPWNGTHLPSAGPATPIRLRGLIAAAGTTGTTTGACLRATARPSVPTPAQREFAVTGAPVEHTSSTPGDLPPEDPLS